MRDSDMSKRSANCPPLDLGTPKHMPKMHSLAVTANNLKVLSNTNELQKGRPRNLGAVGHRPSRMDLTLELLRTVSVHRCVGCAHYVAQLSYA